MNKLIVISGCSGGGKSTLISELGKSGYCIVPEAGREIVKEQLQLNGNLTPWQNPRAFSELLVERSIAAFHHASAMTNVVDNMIFFDRSFLEGVSYYQTLYCKDANQYDHFIDDLRYYSTIFMTPPWKEIYRQDEERQHSFTDAVKEYERLLEFYPRHGYTIVEIPRISVSGRVQFLLSAIK